jgi:DNA polymerase II large subunit
MTRGKTGGGKTIIEGIQAETVQADVLAVGHRAKAFKTVASNEQTQQLIKVIGELRRGLDSLNLNTTQRKVVEEDVQKLEDVAKKGKPDPKEAGSLLQSIVSKLKMAGVVLKEALALSEPIGKIAALFGIALKGLS